MAAGLGFIEFSTGDVLSAAAANGYLASQTVMVFANAAARTSAIASPQEGMVSFLKDTDTLQFYTGSAWSNVDTGASPLTTKGDLYGYSTTNARIPIGTNGQVLMADSSTATGLKWAAAPGGLNLVTTQTFTAVTSVSVNSCFSSSYQNYMIVINAHNTATANLVRMRLRASGTDSTVSYYDSFYQMNWTNGGIATDYANNDSSWRARIGHLDNSSTNQSAINMTLFNPFAASNTSYSNVYMDVRVASGASGFTGGVHNVATSYDGFTLLCDTAMTGTIRVYGMAN